MDREALYERIEQPASTPCSRQASARKCRRRTPTAPPPTARKALGFQELLDGDVEAMRTKTRRYAKRQLTWLRKLPNTYEIDMTNRTPEDVAAELEGRI